MIRFTILLSFAFSLMILIATAGCGKSSSSDSATSSTAGTTSLSGSQKEAADAAMAEIKNHWTKSPDGWITARISGSPYAPDHFLRQLRDITIVDVQPDELSDSDKLNGVDWSGEATFKESPCREAGDPGMLLDGLAGVTVSRQHGQWTPWTNYTPETVRLLRVKGKWQINQDTWLLRGSAPTAQDFSKAGVK